ncbi:MAG: aminotransferase class V-fold PLP-dependent enzyme, partial [Erysipelotrichaceae bacterium]|nr:aminotransferase class V-fold PLP-dependent enzyme [Erysipelotrichaceae bacterium]
MIYFDNTSTTKIADEVLNTYDQVLRKYYVNSEAIYPSGMEVHNLMEKSRSQIARFLSVLPREII